MAKKAEEKKEQKVFTPEQMLQQALKDNADKHFNFEEEVYYRVSTGSLLLDLETNGGLMPGMHRFVGISEGGKSSEALAVIYNALLESNRRGLLVKAEGRLSQEIKNRSGIRFVYDAAEWVDGTCFVLESNNFEFVFETIRGLVTNNPTKKQYIFAIDCLDAMQLNDDQEKTLYEAAKVAGGPLITAVFMKKVALSMAKRGHICILISQVRADISLNPYQKGPVRQTSAVGGNAALHYANFIFEFEPRFKDDLILEDGDAKIDRKKNRVLGHWAKITIKKSPNEKTNLQIKYPIKYGQSAGKSIWHEQEVAQVLLEEGLVKKEGKFFNFDKTFRAELTEKGFDVKEQYEGMARYQNLFENNPQLTDYCFQKLKNLLILDHATI